MSGAPEVRLLVYRSKEARANQPLVVDIHGGGFALRADNFPAGPARLAALGTAVVSVDYRPSTETPFPGGVEDCYAALCWAAESMDIDRERVVVSGVSAGGALAAALTLMARDWGGPAIAFQALVIPVIDDRCDTPSMRQYDEGPLFGGRLAKEMWVRYLGPDADGTTTSPYAAPGRAEDLHGLPPAFIQVNGLDPLRDEGIQYALEVDGSRRTRRAVLRAEPASRDERGSANCGHCRTALPRRDAGRAPPGQRVDRHKGSHQGRAK